MARILLFLGLATRCVTTVDTVRIEPKSHGKPTSSHLSPPPVPAIYDVSSYKIWRFIYCVCLYRSKKCSILNMYSDYRVCCVYSDYRHFAPLYPPTVIITHVLSRDKGFLWPPDTLFYILRTLSGHGDQTGRWLGPMGRMPIGRVVHTSTIFGRFAKEQCILIDWQWRLASISLRLCAKWTSQKWNTLTNWSTGLG